MKFLKDFFFVCQTKSWTFVYFIIFQWFTSIQQNEIVLRLIRSANLIRLMSLTELQVLIRLMRLSKLINLTKLKILIDQMIFIRLMIFARLINSWDELLWAVLFLKMLMKQIVKCKALLTRLTNFIFETRILTWSAK